jgi:hypothetical protein
MLERELELISLGSRMLVAARLRIKILEDGLERDVKAIEEKLAFRRLCVAGIREIIEEVDTGWGRPKSILADVSMI